MVRTILIIMSKILIDKFIIIFTSIFFASMFLIETDLGYITNLIKILVVISPIIILLLNISKNCFKFSIIIEPYHWHMLLFTSYCWLSTIWANETYSSIIMGMRILKFMIYLWFFGLAFQNTDNILPMLKGAMYGGFLISILFISFEGIGNIIYYICNSDRIENDFINANLLGLQATYSILINFFFIIVYKREKKFLPFSVLSLIVVAVSASRKAFVALIIGLILIYLLYKCKFNKITINKFLNSFVLPLFAIFISVTIISNSSLFNVMIRRMNGLINALTGAGRVDGSSSIRFAMNKLGFKIFLENPIIGIGINNSKFLVGRKLGKYFYLHNNYTELLACSGLIGFIIFYSFYVYLLYEFFKYRIYKNSEYYLCVILLFIRLILDYGCVTYSNPSTYYYLILFYLQIKIMRKKSLDKLCLSE